MGDVRIAKSCLSERLRAAKTSEKLFESAGGELGAVRVSVKSPQAKQAPSCCGKWCTNPDIGSELEAIFAREFNNNQTTAFGCSPPKRATNPLSRDGLFRRIVLVNPNLTDRKSIVEAYAGMMPEL